MHISALSWGHQVLNQTSKYGPKPHSPLVPLFFLLPLHFLDAFLSAPLRHSGAFSPTQKHLQNFFFSLKISPPPLNNFWPCRTRLAYRLSSNSWERGVHEVLNLAHLPSKVLIGSWQGFSVECFFLHLHFELFKGYNFCSKPFLFLKSTSGQKANPGERHKHRHAYMSCIYI